MDLDLAALRAIRWVIAEIRGHPNRPHDFRLRTRDGREAYPPMARLRNTINRLKPFYDLDQTVALDELDNRVARHIRQKEDETGRKRQEQERDDLAQEPSPDVVQRVLDRVDARASVRLSILRQKTESAGTSAPPPRSPPPPRPVPPRIARLPRFVLPIVTSVRRTWGTIWAPFGGPTVVAQNTIGAIGRSVTGGAGRLLGGLGRTGLGFAAGRGVFMAATFVASVKALTLGLLVAIGIGLAIIVFQHFHLLWLISGAFAVPETGGATDVPTTPVDLNIGIPDLDAQGLIAEIEQKFGLKLEGTWSQKGAADVYQTMSLVSQSSQFISLTKSREKPISVRAIAGDRRCGGYVPDRDTIEIYNPAAHGGCGSTTVAYTLIHELGHIIQGRSPEVYYEHFERAGIALQENDGLLKTYPLSNSVRESFAEMVAVYIVYNKYTFSKLGRTFPEFPREYPRYYAFARDIIFGGVIFS